MVAALLSLQVQPGVLQLGRQPLRLLLQLLDVPLRLLAVGLQVADLHTHTYTQSVCGGAGAGGGAGGGGVGGLTLRSSCRLFCVSTSSLSSSSCCSLFLVNSISLMARSYFSRHSPPVQPHMLVAQRGRGRAALTPALRPAVTPAVPAAWELLPAEKDRFHFCGAPIVEFRFSRPSVDKNSSCLWRTPQKVERLESN